ncbi:Fc.00g014110.m01.CDS01 [Cosmosporella sp. VM-42]
MEENISSESEAGSSTNNTPPSSPEPPEPPEPGANINGRYYLLSTITAVERTYEYADSDSIMDTMDRFFPYWYHQWFAITNRITNEIVDILDMNIISLKRLGAIIQFWPEHQTFDETGGFEAGLEETLLDLEMLVDDVSSLLENEDYDFADNSIINNALVECDN